MKKEEFKEVIPFDGQVEEGVEFNPVTTDDTEQDNFNEDTVEEMNDEGVEIVYEDEN